MDVKPLEAIAIPVDTSDEQLVARAQEGSSEAFAVLFRRYRPAIARYAGRMLGDDARAEDVVQEVFLSALRGIDGLDRPAGFKPWLYRIAHNACVDHMRRNRRADEVSMDASVLPAAEEIRLFRQAPSTHAALSQKEDFRNLREAFRGLPPSQSEVLVMRELEGLSYDEIAARMGITRASVESMLFRARQGLRDEYGEIATGARCERMRPVMARMAEGLGGLRDRRALARHVRNCGMCRRDAYAMGLGGSALEAPATGVRGRLSRVASLLPLPWLIHRRGDDPSAASSAAGGGGGSLTAHAQTAITQLSSTMSVSADHAATGIQKAVAVVAAVAVVGGGGIVASKTESRGELPLKPDSTLTPARADIGPVVPPSLLTPARHGGAPVAAAAPGAANLGAPPGAGPPAAPTSLLAPTPGGVPGALGTPTTPTALGSPAIPEAPASAPDGSPGSSAPAGDTGGGATVPAADGPSSAGTGAGTDTPSGGGPTSGGDTGSTSGGSSSAGGDTSGATNGGSNGGGSQNGAFDDPCVLPPGLEKKDKIPPGHLKKCPELGAATVPAP
jgi:RNA polymerase sigma factor (sigma-70 family)